MQHLASASGGKLTTFAKHTIGSVMFDKGRAFLHAAVLLEQNGGDRSASTYLWCQGFEVCLKGLLLLRDYDTYQPLLKKIRHDLVRLAETTLTAYGRRSLPSAVLGELTRLNNLYKGEQFLRYGTGYDLFLNFETIPTNEVKRFLVRVVRLTDRVLHN